jgi:hypothetical protein
MRTWALAGVVLLAACEQASENVLPRPSAPGNEWDCQPTIARMVPPQAVMDTMFAGMSPRPSATPTREAWAASANWIGNDAMWLSLPPDGIFERRYHKLLMVPLKGGPISITGRRLDGDGSDRSGMFWAHASSANIGSSVDFAKSGCWELVYNLGGEQLTFTLKVEG